MFAARFVARQPFPDRDLKVHLRGRPSYSVDGTSIRYHNANTGASFALRLEEGDALLLEIEVPRPPFFATEAALEVEALGLEAQPEGDDGLYDLVSAYEEANAAAHAALIDSGDEAAELSSRLLEPAWRWNYNRAAIAHAIDASVRVPNVEVVIHPETERAVLAAVWDGSSAALVPDVELFILSEAGGAVSWVDAPSIASELAALGIRSAHYRYETETGLRECGMRHYDASLGAAIALESVRRTSEKLRRVPLQDVRSQELLRLALGLDTAGRRLQPSEASSFPAECAGFLRTRTLKLARVLGGYTWRSPWKLESIALTEKRGVVVGVGAGGIVFFDVQTGRRIKEARGDVHAGVSVGISEDASTVTIGDEGGNLRVFDVHLEGPGPALEVRSTHAASKDGTPAYVLGVSADGSVVVGAVGDDAVVLRNGEAPTSFPATGAIATSRDLSRLWLGQKLVDVTTEATLLSLATPPDTFRVPALSPDGTLLAFGMASGELRLIRFADGAILSLVPRTNDKGKPNVARTIVFSPDGRFLVVGDSSGIEVRTVPGLELVKSFPTPTWDAAVGDDTIFRVVDDRIWPQPLEGHAPPVNDGPIDQLFHSPRGPIAIASSVPGESGTGGRAVLWHLPSGEVLRATPRLCPDRINLSSDGRHICLVNDTALTVLDVGTLAEVLVVESLGTERYVRPLDLDCAPDGEHVLVCLEDGTVRMISTRTGRDRWRHMLGVRCATFTPDGGYVVGGDASRLRLIDSKTGEVERVIPLDDPRPLAEHVLLGDGDLAVRVVANSGLVIVDLAKGTVSEAPWPSARDVLAASPDARVVAFTTDEDHGTDLVFWESDAERELDRLSLASASDVPVSAAFSPDGKRLLVGTSLGALLVFERHAE